MIVRNNLCLPVEFAVLAAERVCCFGVCHRCGISETPPAADFPKELHVFNIILTPSRDQKPPIEAVAEINGPTTMSLTGMSATRQKNCNGCVQAKRRCDRRTPTCSRCAEKMIPCVYSKSKINGRSARHGGASDISTSSLAPDFLDYPLIPSDFSMDVDYLDSMTKDFLPDFANGPPNQSPFDANINEDTYMDPLLNLIPGNRSSSPSQWLVCTKTDHVPESQTNEIYVRNCSAMAGCVSRIPSLYRSVESLLTSSQENIKPWHVYDPTTSLYFIWSRVKGFVPELGTKNALPFLHPHLYRSYMPQCILSCFATCVLYTSRTSVNTAMVMQSLYSNVGSLIAANTSRFVSTPIEKLARAQALFLYQIIRLFDGDVALRSQAEKDMPLFMTWVEELCNMRDNLGGPTVLEDSSVKSPQTIDWEVSVRLEIVMGCMT